jgi:hypothetical protein
MQDQGGAQDNQDQGGGGGGRRSRGGQGGGGQNRGQGRGGDIAGGGRGGEVAAGSGGAGAPGGRGGFANLSEEDRKKMTDLRQKMQSATGDEREKLQQQMQEMMQKLGLGRGRGQSGDAAGGRGGDAAGGRGGDAAGGGGQGRGGRGGGAGNSLEALLRRPTSQYTEEERNNAKLPRPPEEDSQVQVLLRPGLLADVQIEVEKIPNALHVPAQAVFNRNGKYMVFVQQKKTGKFEAREVQLIKQSESTMVLASGVQPGETIALADPTAEKKSKADKKSPGGNPMGGMPGGKS